MNKLDIQTFKKKNDFLICIDSDGTVIDAMNAKHLKCHGPAFIENWQLALHKEEVQSLWNDINLFQETRGINRFIALVQILDLLQGKYVDEPQIDSLRTWVETTDDLSNKGLEAYVVNHPTPLLKKALVWSYDINKRIKKLSTADKLPFEGVKEFLTYAKGKVDIAVVSSSNMDAIYHEWDDHQLLEFLDVMTSQEVGTKGECLAAMIKKGYAHDHVLMIGDAYPDLDAANENNTYFYPILTRKEKLSWNQLQQHYFNPFIEGKFKDYQAEVIQAFKNNFGKRSK